MNAGNDHKCAAVSAEDLVLYAYGETDDPRIAGHVAGCAECRAFVVDLERVRDVAQRAGTLEPGLAVVAGLKARAARQVRGRAAAHRKDRARTWPRWALAAAAVVIAATGLVIYRYQSHQDISRVAASTPGVPAYLAGVSGQIAELESQVGDSADAGGLGLVAEAEAGDSVAESDFSMDPGVWDLVVEPEQDVGDLELAMNDLESQVDLLGYEDTQDGGAAGTGSGGDRLELPMLRGVEDRASL